MEVTRDWLLSLPLKWRDDGMAGLSLVLGTQRAGGTPVEFVICQEPHEVEDSAGALEMDREKLLAAMRNADRNGGTCRWTIYLIQGDPDDGLSEDHVTLTSIPDELTQAHFLRLVAALGLSTASQEVQDETVEALAEAFAKRLEQLFSSPTVMPHEKVRMVKEALLKIAQRGL